jgi:predicted deacetylase
MSAAPLPPAEESSRTLVVSLYDVSPQTRAECAEMLIELAALGVPRCSLLVIPDHYRRGHFLADAECAAWLRAQAAAGHEAGDARLPPISRRGATARAWARS